jgi:hypothetical protein
MVSLKPGVSLSVLQPQILLAVIVVESIWRAYGHKSLVLTSVADGVHRSDSLHYVGNAIDIRTRDLPRSRQELLRTLISQALGAEFDVVLESDHLHIEFDPKR